LEFSKKYQENRLNQKGTRPLDKPNDIGELNSEYKEL